LAARAAQTPRRFIYSSQTNRSAVRATATILAQQRSALRIADAYNARMALTRDDANAIFKHDAMCALLCPESPNSEESRGGYD
jgi:hypothetical protein